MALARRPLRMAGEESSQKAELVDQKEAEANTDYPGGDAEDAADAGEAAAREGQRHRHGRGHTHHAHHGARAKDQ